MKNGIKIIAALTVACGALLGTSLMHTPAVATVAVDCVCGSRHCDGRCRLLHRRNKCRTCQSDCGCVECPSCACDICQLEVNSVKVEKTCFEVEQKVICIPPIRFPWMDDCPPMTSRTKTINVLKKHTYECPDCEYKWTRVEPVECLPTSIQGASIKAPGMNQPFGVPSEPALPATANSESDQSPVIGSAVIGSALAEEAVEKTSLVEKGVVKSDVVKLKAVKSDVVKSKAVKSDVVKSKAVKSDVAQPKAIASHVAGPGTIKSLVPAATAASVKSAKAQPPRQWESLSDLTLPAPASTEAASTEATSSKPELAEKPGQIINR